MQDQVKKSKDKRKTRLLVAVKSQQVIDATCNQTKTVIVVHLGEASMACSLDISSAKLHGNEETSMASIEEL